MESKALIDRLVSVFIPTRTKIHVKVRDVDEFNLESDLTQELISRFKGDPDALDWLYETDDWVKIIESLPTFTKILEMIPRCEKFAIRPDGSVVDKNNMILTTTRGVAEAILEALRSDPEKPIPKILAAVRSQI